MVGPGTRQRATIMRLPISFPPARHPRIARRFVGEDQGGLAAILCLVALCVALGAAVSRGRTGSEIAAAAVAAGGGSAIAGALGGLDGLALLALAVVPWLVVLLNVTPRLTLTVASAAAAVLLLTRASLGTTETATRTAQGRHLPRRDAALARRRTLIERAHRSREVLCLPSHGCRGLERDHGAMACRSAGDPPSERNGGDRASASRRASSRRPGRDLLPRGDLCERRRQPRVGE